MKAGFPHDHLHQTVEDVCRKGRLPATSGSDSQSLRGGDGRRLHVEKHSSRGSRPLATATKPGRMGITRPRRGLPGLADPNSVHAEAWYPRRPCHQRNRPEPPSGRPPNLRGPPPTRSPVPPHRRAERRLLTDLRPPGPGRSRPTPPGPDAEVSRRLLGCSAIGRAEQPAAPPCGPDVQCAKREASPRTRPAHGTAVATPQERSRIFPERLGPALDHLW